MSVFSKEKFLGGKLTPTSIFRRIGEVWESQNAVVPDRVLNRTDVPPYMSDLLIWTDGKTYDPTTHQIKSRISPQYNLTLKQGLCGGGASNLYVIPSTSPKAFPLLAGAWAVMMEFTTGDSVAGTQFLHYRAGAGNLRFLFSITSGRLTVRMGLTAQANIDDAGDISANTHYIIASTGTTVGGAGTAVTYIWKNGVRKKMADYAYTDLTEIAGSCSFGTGSNSFQGCWHKVAVWETAQDSSTLNDFNSQAIMAIVFQKRAVDIAGNYTFTVDTLDYTRRTDNCFYLSEKGFAVKSGVVYPKLLDGSGYAGLVGEPDAVYHGLIAQTGKIEVKGQSYFDTLFSFTQNPNTEIINAGIIIHGAGAMNGENCNLNNILTAETSLNTSYPNALTASVLNTESIQVFNGTNNANQRVFVKVTNPVYKADNSSLLESGTITDILVYKRDLTPDEQVRVMLWCHNLDFLSVDLVKVGAEYLFVDDNIVYVCKV